MIMTCQYRFIRDKKKCTILVSDVGNEGGYARVGPGAMWELSVPFSQCCYKPETIQKYKVLKNKIITASQHLGPENRSTSKASTIQRGPA